MSRMVSAAWPTVAVMGSVRGLGVMISLTFWSPRPAVVRRDVLRLAVVFRLAAGLVLRLCVFFDALRVRRVCVVVRLDLEAVLLDESS
jgi:hypothetical protein